MPLGPWLSLSLLAAPPVAPASAPAPSPDQIRLFLDPQRTWVDQEFLQKQIDWVDWVRDRQAASAIKPCFAKLWPLTVVVSAIGQWRSRTKT